MTNHQQHKMELASATAFAAAALYDTAGDTTGSPLQCRAAQSLLEAAMHSTAGADNHHSANAAIMLTILADRMTGEPHPVDREVASAARRALAAARNLGPSAPEGFATLAAREYDTESRTGFQEFAAVWREYQQ